MKATFIDNNYCDSARVENKSQYKCTYARGKREINKGGICKTGLSNEKIHNNYV